MPLVFNESFVISKPPPTPSGTGNGQSGRACPAIGKLGIRGFYGLMPELSEPKSTIPLRQGHFPNSLVLAIGREYFIGPLVDH